MENVITYKFNWCEYLTPCPHGNDCYVGDYDCAHCSNFVKHVWMNNIPYNNINDHSRYFRTSSGQIICSR